jgi:hypothetical protein
VKTENFASLTGEKDRLITSKTLFRTMVYKYQAAENSQSNAEQRAEKCSADRFLQLRKSCDRLSRKNHSYHGGRLNQYCRHDQKPFQPTTHPGVFNLFCSLARPFHSGREITSQNDE